MELRGKTIVITRAASQSEEMRMSLEAAGARVIECPAIEIVPVENWTEVDRAASNLHTYDWLVLTSTNAVAYFMERLRTLGLTCRTPIAVIGTATAEKLARWDLKPSRIPDDFRAEGLLDRFETNLNGVRILIPRAETAREYLPEQLRARGATVNVVTVYRTIKPAKKLIDLRRTLVGEKIDAVVFTSPSAVRHFAEELGDAFSPVLGAIPIAVIGPVARKAVEAAGLQAVIEPERATIQDLIEAIRSYFSNREAST